MAVKRSIVEQLYNIQLYTKEELEELKRRQEAELEAQLQALMESAGGASKPSPSSNAMLYG